MLSTQIVIVVAKRYLLFGPVGQTKSKLPTDPEFHRIANVSRNPAARSPACASPASARKICEALIGPESLYCKKTSGHLCSGPTALAVSDSSCVPWCKLFATTLLSIISFHNDTHQTPVAHMR